jgi:glycosyltransferase involved in cell wall biosynthesis
MQIEFYHIDAFEIAQYEPIWRALKQAGVDARIIGAAGADNTAAPGWFDFALFRSYCEQHAIPFHSEADPRAALAVTTQNAAILRQYAGKKVRLMYGPIVYPQAWGLQPHAVQPFDAVLHHGPAYGDLFARWLPPAQLAAIGYPRYDDFFAGRLPRAQIRARWGVNDSRPVLAFLPTWGPNTGFDTFLPALLRLSERYQIILRPHHCTLHFEPERMALLRASGLPLLDNAYALPEVYAGADVVLSDARGGAVFEAAMCGVPAVGMVLDPAEVNGWIAQQGVAALMNACTDPAQLEAAIEQALGSATQADARRRFAEQRVLYRDGSAAHQAAQALIRLAEPDRVQVAVAPAWRCKVSVVLPTYNHLDFLPSAVAAILNQSFKDFELIIVNDGSKDATEQFLATLTDPRIKVINRDNGGLPSALNRGFADAGGEYRTWTSADNITGPTWLERLVYALDTAPPSVGFANSTFAIIDEHDRLVRIQRGATVRFDSVAAKNVGVTSFMYRTTVAQQVGDYDVDLNGAEDWDMWQRILEVSDAVHVDTLLYYYRLHSNSMTSSMPEKVAIASRAVIDKLLQRHGGAFDLDRFYPRLHQAEDQALARWQAKTRIASFMIDTPFCPATLSANLLIEALRERYAPEVHGNLLRLLVLYGGWDLALQSLDQFQDRLPAARVAALRPLLVNRDAAAINQLPLHRTSESELLFRLGH